MQKTTVDTSTLEKPRIRLFWEYRCFLSWHQVANRRGVNVAYVYNYARHGIVPANPEIRHALGIPRSRKRTLGTIDRDMQLPISDMPADSLRAAFLFRTEMR